jgi:hypothetical protein
MFSLSPIHRKVPLAHEYSGSQVRLLRLQWLSEPRMLGYLCMSGQYGDRGACTISFPFWGGAGSKGTELTALFIDTELR